MRYMETGRKHIGWTAFARIWLLNNENKVLELAASAGLYTHLNGAHARILVGSFKIGLIAAVQKPHLTNNVQTDERVRDTTYDNFARDFGERFVKGYKPVSTVDYLLKSPFKE